MKRIIIAICGIMVAGGAMGARTVSFPFAVGNDKIEAWGVANNSKYTTSIKSLFAPTWQYGTTSGTFGDAGSSPRATCKTQNYPDADWTYSGVGEYSSVGNGSDDEGAITPIIARKIYKHGGKFCMTQIQAGWTRHGEDRFFIDFFDDNRLNKNSQPMKRYKCETICEPGWCGDNCDKSNCHICDAPKNYTKLLNNRNDGDLKLVCGGEAGLITDKVDVFRYDAPKPGIDHDIDYVVLGVLNIHESWVEVAPVKVRAHGKKIIDAYVASGSEYKILCAPGYELNDAGDGCKLSSYCTDFAQLCSGERMDLFNEDKKHEWMVRTTNGNNTCMYIGCQSGYGLDPNRNDKTCILCKTTSKQGINSNGECEKCDEDEIFKTDGCHRYTTYSAQDLVNGVQRAFDCWLEKDPVNYGTCVKCAQPKKYNATEHTCQ